MTANGRPDTSDVSIYVINKSSIDKSGSSTAGSGSVYLGRPWSQYATVVVQNTVLGAIINGAGWEVWGASDPRTSGVTFQEYGNQGAGASGTRASFAKKIAAPVSISTVLGSGYASWADTSYLA